MALAIMNVAAVVSLGGFSSETIYGPLSAFYYLFAAIVFLIPTAMVAAGSAAMFLNKQGGKFRWIGEEMGDRTVFLATMDRKYHPVLHRAYIWCCFYRLYRDGPHRLYGLGIQ